MISFRDYLYEKVLDNVKKELEKLIKGDKEIKKQKTIQDKLDYIYRAYEKNIENIMTHYRVDYDKIVKIIKEII